MILSKRIPLRNFEEFSNLPILTYKNFIKSKVITRLSKLMVEVSGGEWKLMTLQCIVVSQVMDR